MSYYKKNRDVLLKKAHVKYHNGGGKDKARKCYIENKEEIKKKEKGKDIKKWTNLKKKTK